MTEPWRTAGEYRMTLQGGAGENFAGQPVRERQLSGLDSCHPATPAPPFPVGSLTGLVNVVVDSNNKWEKDQIGWREDRVAWYQANRAGILPCGFYASQGMEIATGPGIWRQYQVNFLEMVIKPNSVLTYRAPEAWAERQWPE
jgi:hypothetical protein